MPCSLMGWLTSTKKKNPTTQARSLSPSWKEVMDASKIPVVSCCDGIWIVLQD